jgi:hypothetical protein
MNDRQRIIELFATARPAYSRADVMRLTRVTEAELQEAGASLAITMRRRGDEEWIEWDDVAQLALDGWTPRMIAAALGRQEDDVVPYLNRFRLVELQLPIYQLRVLHYLAERQSQGRGVPRNASDIIEEELAALASEVDPEEADAAIPGFRDALRFPYSLDQAPDQAADQAPDQAPDRAAVQDYDCRYCGLPVSVKGAEICDECNRRHHPEIQLGEYGLPALEEHDE